jgi:hypothetical protein
VPTISPEVEQIVLAALAKNPKERFATIQSFAAALEQASSLASNAPMAFVPPVSAPVSASFQTVPPSLLTAPSADPPASVLPAKAISQASLSTPARPGAGSLYPSLPISKPRSAWRGKTVLAVLACVFVLVSGSLFYAFGRKNSLASTPPTPTLTPQSTPQRAVTPTVNPVSLLRQYEANAPDYFDPLNSAVNVGTTEAQWANLPDRCVFQGNGYLVTKEQGDQFCRETGKAYGDAVIRVNEMLLAGHSAGLAFRDQYIYGSNTAYFFEIFVNGDYLVAHTDDWNDPLQQEVFSPAIHTGYNTTNTLEVIARGNSLSFFINGVFLVHLTNNLYSQGVISLAGFSGSTSSLAAIFSSLEVWNI